MIICRTVESIAEELSRTEGDVGLVPTMGYLHEGHMSLVRQSAAENRVTVVSVFVNPTQFAPNEDFASYPRDIDRDAAMLEEAGVDFVFAPDPRELYGPGFSTYVEIRDMAKLLCGHTRPGHFRGVLTVVIKLFHIISPCRAYFGSKDAQQAVMVNRMIKDLNMNVKLRVMPIVRDADGLAMSSRNIYLSKTQRMSALALPKALKKSREMICSGERNCSLIRQTITHLLDREAGITRDYVEIVDLMSLRPLAQIKEEGTLVAAAVFVGKTRLIDNYILGEI